MSNRAAQPGSIMLALVLGACYQPPTETQLIRSFTSHRTAYDKLATMAVADRKFSRVAAGEIAPSGMPESRFNEYQAIFHELGIETSMNWGIPSYPAGLFIVISSCIPLGGKGQAVGYAYLPTAPDAIEKQLSISGCPIQIHSARGHRIVFRPLQDRWYLFYFLEW